MPGCVQSGTGFPDGQAFEKCVPEFAFGMGRSFPLRCFAESASHSGRSKWDTLSQRRSNGKLRPIIRSRNGMLFPNESKTGKCIPQSALKVGRRFPTGNHVPESAPKVGRTFPTSLNRKIHPGIQLNSGTHFPNRVPSGNCIPFQTRIPGHTFRKQRRPHNVAFVLRRTVRAGNLICLRPDRRFSYE